MVKTEILKQLNNEFEKAKELAEYQAQINIYKALKNQEFAYLDSQVNTLTIEIAKAEYNGDETTAKQLKSRKEELMNEQEILLKKMGLSLQSLKPNYACKKCNDSGFVKGKPCECFKTALSNKLLEQSNLKLENIANFSKSNLDLFSDKYKNKIIKIYKLMQDFCNNFPNTNKITKVILSGGTGTGKTFLTECVSYELIKKGFYVYYTTAFNLNNQLLNYHLSSVSEKQSIIKPLLDCDCLVIDDLGVEPIRKNVTLEYLLTIISERAINSKHTLISTNLTPEDIMERYGERIYSRLVDKSNSIIVSFSGEDLRVKRK